MFASTNAADELKCAYLALISDGQMLSGTPASQLLCYPDLHEPGAGLYRSGHSVHLFKGTSSLQLRVFRSVHTTSIYPASGRATGGY